jgi:hypothetical protein
MTVPLPGAGAAAIMLIFLTWNEDAVAVTGSQLVSTFMELGNTTSHECGRHCMSA